MFIGLYLKKCSGDLRRVLWEWVTKYKAKISDAIVHFKYKSKMVLDFRKNTTAAISRWPPFRHCILVS